MDVVILGGHGRVALHLARQLAGAGHRVTSLIRNPDHTEGVSDTGATPVVADLERLDTDEIAERLTGQDAAVWSAGAGGGDPARTYAVDRDAAIRTIDASVRAGVGRFVMVSYFGAGPDHGVPADHSFFPYAEAKAAADAHLRASPLAWTILGPSALTDGPSTGRIEVGADRATSVPREDVAGVVAAVLVEPATVGRSIAFNAGSTPIGEALTG
jgi:uncharacterized protein YbjT (DUF2867 family)